MNAIYEIDDLIAAWHRDELQAVLEQNVERAKDCRKVIAAFLYLRERLIAKAAA